MKNFILVIILFTLNLVLIISINSETPYDYSFEKKYDSKGTLFFEFKGKYKPSLSHESYAKFHTDVNLVLEKLNLPKLSDSYNKKVKIADFRNDFGMYEWSEYPEGQLKILRSSGTDVNFDSYDCINTIILSK